MSSIVQRTANLFPLLTRGGAAALIVVAAMLMPVRQTQAQDTSDAGPAGQPLIVSQPLRESAMSGPMRFTRLDERETGITFQNQLEPEHIRKYLLNGAGLCTGDYDNDGRTDMYLICQDGPNQLYRQAGDWKFENVTAAAGAPTGGDLWGTGGVLCRCGQRRGPRLVRVQH